MSTLTEAAKFSKKTSVWVAIGIVTLIILLILLGVMGRVRKAFFPPKPLPPTVAFWKLPRMDLSEGIAGGGKTFTLDTITGGFPALPDRAKVFAVAQTKPYFGQLDEVKNRLANMGFAQEPIEISPGIFRFIDSRGKTMTVELTSGNFMLERDLAGDPAISASRPRSVEEAQNRAISFLANMGVKLVDFPVDKIETVMLRVDGTKVVATDSLSTTNLIQVRFGRDDFDQLPVIWPVEDLPKFYVTVSGSEVVEARMEILPIQKFKFATYPLKGPQRAFEDLKAGRGAFNKPVTTSEVKILDIKLGYVESTKNAEYLAPVYLFRAVGDLVGYVSAVDDIWIK